MTEFDVKPLDNKEFIVEQKWNVPTNKWEQDIKPNRDQSELTKDIEDKLNG